MSITKISIDSANNEVSIDRAFGRDYSKEYVAMTPRGERGWLIANLLIPQIKKLMSKSTAELQELHLEQLKI